MRFAFSLVILLLMVSTCHALNNAPKNSQWPKTDFEMTIIDLDEFMSGGPPKDGIPAINKPKFESAAKITTISNNEPVISIEIKGDARAYPVQILMFHEIVNDTVGGIPVSITYCPLCNTSLTFLRTVEGKVLDFGTTGNLRHSNMIMYDRQTESWWQQATGQAIVGKMMGKRLELHPTRMESFELFKKRFPNGKVLVPNDPKLRPYGHNPYGGYDSGSWPFLYKGDYKGPPDPLARLVVVGDNAWPLSLVRSKGTVEFEGLVITWQDGQSSALDAAKISEGRDIGNVVVTKNGKDVVYDLPFAFVYKQFNPGGKIHMDD